MLSNSKYIKRTICRFLCSL